MSATAVDVRLRLQFLLWYGVMGLGVLLLGMFMASDQFFAAFIVAGVGWLALLPYHAQLSLHLALATFGSAFIVPFLAGRPYMWEMAALLAWTGVPIVIFLRRYPADFGRLLREHKWVFVGAALYCAVLVMTMLVRGVGLNILGSSKVGGRLYFQQIICAIFPLLFLSLKLEERTVVRLMVIQWILSATYLLSDAAFTLGGALTGVLYLLEIANDAMNFELSAMRFGVRRFQSFAIFGTSMILLLLAFNNLRDFLGRRALWLLPLTAVLAAIGVASGHRVVVLTLAGTGFVVALAQRFFTIGHLFRLTLIGVAALVTVYSTVDMMPQAAQRAVSFLPGLRVDAQSKVDAELTWGLRRTLFRVGFGMIPDYFWVGRGFHKYLSDLPPYHPQQQTLMFHLDQGVFYNGFIGLMVNTGVFGTLGMLIFLYGGTRVAVRIVLHLRRHGCEDTFARIASVAAGVWTTGVVLFIFLHGDAETAMKTFSLQAGLLLVCDKLLRKRQEAAMVAEA